jgi:hypothetical protein
MNVDEVTEQEMVIGLVMYSLQADTLKRRPPPGPGGDHRPPQIQIRHQQIYKS